MATLRYAWLVRLDRPYPQRVVGGATGESGAVGCPRYARDHAVMGNEHLVATRVLKVPDAQGPVVGPAREGLASGRPCNTGDCAFVACQLRPDTPSSRIPDPNRPVLA